MPCTLDETPGAMSNQGHGQPSAALGVEGGLRVGCSGGGQNAVVAGIDLVT